MFDPYIATGRNLAVCNANIVAEAVDERYIKTDSCLINVAPRKHVDLCEKTCLQGFQPGHTQTSMLSYRD